MNMNLEMEMKITEKAGKVRPPSIIIMAQPHQWRDGDECLSWRIMEIAEFMDSPNICGAEEGGPTQTVLNYPLPN